jgi:putative nucleotidyltransferase with HDIG domain
MEKMLDRREKKRWELALACRVDSNGTQHKARILDLSEGGAFVECQHVPQDGSQITLTLNLDDEQVFLDGIVRHAGSYAVRFDSVSGFGLDFEAAPLETIKTLMYRYHLSLPEAGEPRKLRLGPGPVLSRLSEVNREVWLVLSLLVISAIANLLVISNEMVLAFYTIPTVFSAYFYGRRHATLTATASVLLVVLVSLFGSRFGLPALGQSAWVKVAVWGGTLIITGYAMGSLYEHVKGQLRELRETYYGVLMILQQFISNDKYTQNHSYRVSVYATRIAREMGLDEERIEDIRAAALLHDIGKLDISREILYKAAQLDEEERSVMKSHVEKGVSMLKPVVGGALNRILPIILAHHDSYDGSGYHQLAGEGIPLEARIIAVADVYDALTSDRPYRKAMTPFEARDMIQKSANREFDPKVVAAFTSSFGAGQMEVPEIMV